MLEPQLVKWRFFDDEDPKAREEMQVLLEHVERGDYVLNAFSPFVGLDGKRYVFVLLERPAFREVQLSRQLEMQVAIQLRAQQQRAGGVVPASAASDPGRRR